MKTAASPSTTRLRNALNELATILEQTSYEVSNLESEFQHVLVQATEEAEMGVQKQSQERLVQAVAEAERRTRTAVSEELKAQFAHELARTESARNELAAEREELQRALQRLGEAAKGQQQQSERFKEERDRAVQALAEAKQSNQRELAEVMQSYQRELGEAKQTNQRELAEAKQAFQRELAEAKQSLQRELAEMKHSHERELSEAKQSYQRELSDTEEAAAIALERQIATTIERVRADMAAEGDSLQSKLAELSQASERWHAERSQLTTDLEQARRLLTAAEAEHSKSLSETRRAAAAAFERQMDRVRSELTDECDRLKQEVEQLARSAAQWNTERVRLMGEVERANRLLAESQAAPRAMESPAPAPAATPAPAPAPGPAVPNENLRSEIARVEGQIKAITQIIDDPASELSIVFRKNAERAELESYLKGIRFLTGK